VHRDDAYANLVLAEILRDMRLAGRDAAFATELAYGTLRSLGTLDLIVAAAAGREVARIDPPARDALRLGAYQLLHTRVPAHAAVNQTVDLVRSVAPGASGFANAVMRTISETSLDAWLERLAPAYDEDPVGNLAVLHNHPQWIIRAFAESLGGDLEDTARLLIEDNQPASVHLCARPGRADAVELADEVDGVPGAFSPYAVYLNGGSPRELARSPTAAPTCRTRAPSWSRPALARGPGRGHRPALAGPVRRPGRQSRPARLDRRAARRRVTAVEVVGSRPRPAVHRQHGHRHALDGLPTRRGRCSATSTAVTSAPRSAAIEPSRPALPPGPAHRSSQRRSVPSTGAASSAAANQLGALVRTWAAAVGDRGQLARGAAV